MHAETHQPPEGAQRDVAWWNWKGETVLGLFDSPASPLANCFSGQDEGPELVIVSGPSGVGKSTWCQGFAGWAMTAGAVVGGFISPPVMVNGQKVGIDLVALPGGESRRLAIRRAMEDRGTQTANWQFDLKVVSWANQMLVDLPACDCLILDELGPLEFHYGQGLQAGLELLDGHRSTLALVVIRPKLLSLAKERWPWGRIVSLVDGQMVPGNSGEPVGSQRKA